MEDLTEAFKAEQSQLTFEVLQQVRDIVALNEPREITKNLIREIAIENQIDPELLILHIKFHSIRDMVAAQTVQLIDVPTEDQRADFLTKALRGEVFWRHVRSLLLVR